ncbi:DUF305 domain-containing protein [Streptomyces sp. B6B3]|uniref:DUF305 domain-containing protein n=1 Tax=Streptomyces sp. B6B3 TaxID=3153570 RepID=UPI00325E5999
MTTQGSFRPARHRAAVVAGAAVAALVLAACGSDHDEHSSTSEDTAPSASADQRNAADVDFAQQMIPHHEQAVEMAALAADRAGSQEVRTLAGQIQEAQGPEIETLTGWLEDWGEEVPGAGMDHSGHASGGMEAGSEGDGMMSQEQMEELENASGAAFDVAFLEMMIEHHQGAIAMAEVERAEGSYQPALDMAQDIVASQGAEIDEMNALLEDG